jgi:hypothetical protein
LRLGQPTARRVSHEREPWFPYGGVSRPDLLRPSPDDSQAAEHPLRLGQPMARRVSHEREPWFPFGGVSRPDLLRPSPDDSQAAEHPLRLGQPMARRVSHEREPWFPFISKKEANPGGRPLVHVPVTLTQTHRQSYISEGGSPAAARPGRPTPFLERALLVPDVSDRTRSMARLVPDMSNLRFKLRGRPAPRGAGLFVS